MAQSTTSPRRAVPRTWLHVEQLEERQLLSGSQPTVVEQVFLERLNDARANPAAYGAAIGLDLSSAAPAQPLAFQPQLIQAARQHSWDMNNRGFFSHNTPEGVGAGQRIRGTGLNLTTWGESLIAGITYSTPEEALRGLIVDAGVADLGHRRHLLALDAAFRKENLIGVGVVQNATGPLSNYYSVDTGGDASAYVTGVIYRDTNANGRYDAGEGLGGVTVTASNGTTTTTYQTGGYSLPLAPGTHTVTVSGGGFGTAVSQNVSIGAANVRVNFSPRGGNKSEDFVRRLYQSALGRTATASEVAYWVGVSQTSGRDTVVSAIEKSAEARARVIRTWYVTYLGRAAAAGEEQFWVSTFASGATEEQVLTNILASAEFLNRAAGQYDLSSVDADFMQAMYTQVLGRSATLSEINAWLPHVAALGRQGIVGLFLNSGEYRGRLLYNYYADILGRRSWPSQAEISTWAYSGIDLATVRVIFKSSAEYFG